MTIKLQLTDKLTKRLLVALAVMVIIWALLTPSMLSAYAGLGGYISEKLLGGAGGADSSLYLGSAGSGVTVLGTAPVVTTQPPGLTAVSTGVATLNGNVSSLNGMPNADVWFTWGYSAATMTNSTPTVSIVAPGNQSAVISGFSSGSTVYYRMVSSTDSTAYGAIMSFATSRGIAFWLMLNLITMAMATSVLLVALNVGISGNWVAALILIIIGIVGIIFVRTAILAIM